MKSLDKRQLDGTDRSALVVRLVRAIALEPPKQIRRAVVVKRPPAPAAAEED